MDRCSVVPGQSVETPHASNQSVKTTIDKNQNILKINAIDKFQTGKWQMSQVTRSHLFRLTALAAVAYTGIEMLVGGLFRRRLMADFYAQSGFFQADGPTTEQIFYGVSVHALTGVFVSAFFTRLWWSAQPDRVANPRNFAIVVGAFYWVLVVYGHIGKQGMVNIPLYLSLETLIVILTYGSFAYVLGLLFGERARDGNSHQVQQ